MEFKSVAGLSLPAVGLGTMRQKGEQCANIVSAAIGLGYRHIDTARKYGNEEAVGLGISRSGIARSDVIVTTKLTQDELAPHLVGPAVDSSLHNLGTDYIDVLLIHWPNQDVPLAGTLKALEAVRKQGKATYLGVANFPIRMLEEVVDVPYLIGNQVEYHPYLAQDKALRTLRAHGLLLTAYCPLGRGGDLLEDPVLKGIAADHSRSVAQIVLRWLVDQEGVVTIPGTSNLDHLRENLDIFDFSLDQHARAAIDALARGHRIVNPPHAPRWDDPAVTD